MRVTSEQSHVAITQWHINSACARPLCSNVYTHGLLPPQFLMGTLRAGYIASDSYGGALSMMSSDSNSINSSFGTLSPGSEHHYFYLFHSLPNPTFSQQDIVLV